MEVREALIPSSAKGKFLLKLFNRHVPPCRRPFRRHRHVEFEIALFKSGRGAYTVPGREYDIRAGDVFLFGSNEVHCITNIERGEPMVLMNLHFEPRFVWSSGDSRFDLKYLKIFLHRGPNFSNRLDRSNPALPKIQGLMLQMEREFSEKPPEFELMVKIQLLTLLVDLIRYFYDSDLSAEAVPPVKTQNFEAVGRSMNYIAGHLREPLTLRQLADAAHMSRAYYSTVFKRLNGVSPWEYILSKRVELAMEYLRGGDRTMLEIAGLCGFNSTANFNHAFRRYTGRTPSQFKSGGAEY